ncbi:hypothetical protein BT69DRAFT_1287111 [Atractiella rhizophila]|nr:hypothetical protein BT69DRAFT_1287111 [Atractiella rhizophila]
MTSRPASPRIRWPNIKLGLSDASWVGRMSSMDDLKVLCHAAGTRHLPSLRIPAVPESKAVYTVSLKGSMRAVEGTWWIINEYKAPGRWNWVDQGEWSSMTTQGYSYLYHSTKIPHLRRHHYNIVYTPSSDQSSSSQLEGPSNTRHHPSHDYGSSSANQQPQQQKRVSLWLIHYERLSTTSRLLDIRNSEFYDPIVRTQAHELSWYMIKSVAVNEESMRQDVDGQRQAVVPALDVPETADDREAWTSPAPPALRNERPPASSTFANDIPMQVDEEDSFHSVLSHPPTSNPNPHSSHNYNYNRNNNSNNRGPSTYVDKPSTYGGLPPEPPPYGHSPPAPVPTQLQLQNLARLVTGASTSSAGAPPESFSSHNANKGQKPDQNRNSPMTEDDLLLSDLHARVLPPIHRPDLSTDDEDSVDIDAHLNACLIWETKVEVGGDDWPDKWHFGRSETGAEADEGGFGFGPVGKDGRRVADVHTHLLLGKEEEEKFRRFKRRMAMNREK